MDYSWQIEIEIKNNNVIGGVQFRRQDFSTGIAAPTGLDGNGTGNVNDFTVDDADTATTDGTNVFDGCLLHRAAECHWSEALFPETRIPELKLNDLASVEWLD